MVFWVVCVGLIPPAVWIDCGDAVGPSVRCDAGGVGAAEDHDHGDTECGGDVSGAGVVADDEAGVSHQRNQLGERGSAGKVGHGGIGEGLELLDVLRLGLRAGGDNGEREIRGDSIGEGGETFDGPALVAVGGAGDKNGVAVGRHGGGLQQRCYGIGGGGVVRQDEFHIESAGAGSADYVEVVIDEVDAVWLAGDLVGVEHVGEFACVGHSESFRAAAEPRQRCGSEESLKIEDQVEAGASEAADKRYKGAEGGGTEPCPAEKLSVEGDYFVEVRVVFEQLGEVRAYEPTDPGVGETAAEGG